MNIKSKQSCFQGQIHYISHKAQTTNCDMNFALFTPPEMKEKNPYIVFLSGLTCTEDNFTTKAGAFKLASKLGLALLMPDTSPRGDDVADDDAYDLGQGAGFYINATHMPWAKHFQMESYIMGELLPLVESEFNLSVKMKSIMGHSMGGHGALTLHYKYPDAFQSCSAFAPIVAPSQVAWGQNIFAQYLGDDKQEWQKHDASLLVAGALTAQKQRPILIDQGLDDQFLDGQLKPQIFEQACKHAGQALNLRYHEGYDHSYFFIQSFIDDHLNFHHKFLSA